MPNASLPCSTPISIGSIDWRDDWPPAPTTHATWCKKHSCGRRDSPGPCRSAWRTRKPGWADPLGDELPWTTHQRNRTREVVVNTGDSSVQLPRRRSVLMAGAAFFVMASLGVVLHFSSSAVVDVIAAVRFEVRLAEESPAAGLREATVSDSNRKVYLHQDVLVTNGDIAQAQVVRDTADAFGVVVTFHAAGARKMAEATRAHVGKPLAILIDGEVISCPVIRGPVSTSAVLNGSFTKAEAQRIVTGILGR